MPINPAFMRPGQLIIDVTLPPRPERAASHDEPLHVLVAAYADQIHAAARQLEALAEGGFTVEEVDRRVDQTKPRGFVHYEASAHCEDILSGLAALDAAGAAVSHVQYVTDDHHYEVDVTELDVADPTI